jgi:hypothetical protein
MVLHEQKHESHEHTHHVERNGWKGVNILDENYAAKDPHMLKVLLFFQCHKSHNILDNFCVCYFTILPVDSGMMG